MIVFTLQKPQNCGFITKTSVPPRTLTEEAVDQLLLTELILTLFYLSRLAEIRDRHQLIGDVRGKGLMIGVEMVMDKEKKTPISPDIMADIWENMRLSVIHIPRPVEFLSGDYCNWPSQGAAPQVGPASERQ